MATYINKKAEREIDGIGTVTVEWCETHWKDGFIEKSDPQIFVNGMLRREYQLVALYKELGDSVREMYDNEDDSAQDVTPATDLCGEKPESCLGFGRYADSLHTYKI